MLALREYIKADEVNKTHFERAKKDVPATITKDLINYYKKLKESRSSYIVKEYKRDTDVA